MRHEWILASALVVAAGCKDAGDDDGGADEGTESDGGDAGDDGGTGGDDGTGGDGGTGGDDGSGDDGSGDDGGSSGDDGGDEPRGAGLFISFDDLERARERASSGIELFETQANLVAGRAETAMSVTADPFHMDDVLAIRFGWCEEHDDVDDTLSEASAKLERESDHMRTLALQFALAGDVAHADKAVELMRAWADEHTVVNMYDFDIDFEQGTLVGMTDGYCSDRPWNFALDAMWQTYGLINAGDAYLLLTRNGHDLGADDTALRDWILRLTEAVDASFHAWTKWADAHPNSGSYERYRSDNHLSWCLAGLIAGAAALEDDDLAAYVLDGGSWTNSAGGPYENPSSIRSVIDLAIEADGRIYEEKILRDPPIGYSFFHMWAMMLVARAAEVHYEDGAPGVWEVVGEDDGGLEIAYDRYAGFILGTKVSPEPDQEGDLAGNRWLYEAAVQRWTKPEHREVIDFGDRNTWINQSIGAVPLLIGVDP
jgi:hypothetical protein